MSKQEFMKVQTCVLRVNIHCDGCKQKVRKLLQKIDGVYSVSIDAEQGKVAVSGCVDPARLVNKLEKSGKHAELWGVQKGGSNHHNQVQFMNNQFKNMNLNDGKKKPQKGNGKEQQPKSVLVQNVKGANKDMMKKVQQPNGKDQKSVRFNLPDREEFDMSDHEFDEFGDDFDDEFDDDDEYDDEYDDDEEGEEFGHYHGHGHGHHLPNKAMMPNKVNMMQENGNGPHGPYGTMMPIKGGNHGPYGPRGGGGGGGGGGGLGGGAKKGGVIDLPIVVKGGKGFGNKEGKGGVIDFPIEMKGKGNGNKEGKHGNGGKKEGKGGGGGNGKKMSGGEKNGGKKKKKGGLRGLFGFGKKSSSSKGGSVTKKGSNNNGCMSGDEKKIGNGKKNEGNYKKHESNKMKNDFEIDITSGHGKGGKGRKEVGSGGGKMGQMGDMGRGGASLGQMGMGPMGMGAMGYGGNGGNMGQMGMGPMGGYPMGPMGGVPAAQGLPAQAMMNAGYYQRMGPGPGHGPANPYSQQQYMAMMMNQQRGNGSDMFQPIMYSRPYPAVNYAAPVPSHPPTDSYTHIFSDENTESCNIM